VTEAIASMAVRGAPAIGCAGAFGVALALHEDSADPRPAVEALRIARPTGANLAWAVDRTWEAAAPFLHAGDRGGAAERAEAEALRISAEDIACGAAMGILGAALLRDGDTVLTHCNAGALATAGAGTALAPVYAAHFSGKRLHVLVDETRPALQGARLSAWELQQAGVPCTVIPDGAAATHLRRGEVQAVLVGADRISRNVDFANKVGTYPLALAAHVAGVQLYCLAPTSTLDLSLPDGDAIPLEERSEQEVTTFAGRRLVPEGVPALYLAFDVTPQRYVTAIITERGVHRPPFEKALAGLGSRARRG
jgi:methylthioribose-1-phosphate isomerase